MPYTTDTTPAHGFQFPPNDGLCTNGAASVVEKGEVMVLDRGDNSATVTNFKFGDVASGYSVVRDPTAADGNLGIYVVALARVDPGQKALFRAHGKVRVRTSGTPGKGAVLVSAGASRVLVNGITGHLGKKIVASGEAAASGSPEFQDVLFDGLGGFGAAPI